MNRTSGAWCVYANALDADHKWKPSLNFHSWTAWGTVKKSTHAHIYRKSQILRTCSTGREFVHAERKPWRKRGIFVSRHSGHARGANWNSCFARWHLSWPFCGWSLDLISPGLSIRFSDTRFLPLVAQASPADIIETLGQERGRENIETIVPKNRLFVVKFAIAFFLFPLSSFFLFSSFSIFFFARARLDRE